ncbi:MAG TPA: hypothetical protein VK961_06880 [Chthoniobacter sp.]|nr:hypothetical protein [Chthoniobacter sp.]
MKSPFYYQREAAHRFQEEQHDASTPLPIILGVAALLGVLIGATVALLEYVIRHIL